ncbi:hypothetical protein J6590_003239 [Homalodisca vitripennis]|nr:hypothetical protein J6590_003239 [Homalodisca vitripennis]
MDGGMGALNFAKGAGMTRYDLVMPPDTKMIIINLTLKLQCAPRRDALVGGVRGGGRHAPADLLLLTQYPAVLRLKVQCAPRRDALVGGVRGGGRHAPADLLLLTQYPAVLRVVSPSCAARPVSFTTSFVLLNPLFPHC